MRFYFLKTIASLFVKQSWESGISEEIEFWDRYLLTKGEKSREDFALRTNPHTPLQEYLIEALDGVDDSTLQLLDVGAGPLTSIGKCWENRTITITAVDPLAERYDRLLQKHGIMPLVRTQQGDAEQLTSYFAANTFDLVHARNSIDHCYDPALAVQQMVAVLKPGRLLYMHHAVNEAKIRRYRGFHQWNLFDHGGELYVGNAKQQINLSKLLAPLAEVKNQLFADGRWLVTRIRKLQSVTLTK